ncbi:MAG: PP2C family protein-serine/threonine phosphatase [Planctomycetes bacterium]|nr:PP2C family protein-serine/threonine phosphatase [Planctomycetota bacterium]
MSQPKDGEFERDLETARKIQAGLLPAQVPRIPGYDFCVEYSPAGTVGGDFYDFIQFDKNHLGILIADAAGKGLSGSLLMVEARAVVRAMASVSTSPRDILSRANRVLRQDLQPGLFVTLLFALLKVASGKMTIASAGHLPMMIWRWKAKKTFMVQPSPVVLGAASEERFETALKEDVVTLMPGDRFVLCTDGVTELMNARKEEFGLERLVRHTSANAHLSSSTCVGTLMWELGQHRGRHPQSDDITILTGRMAPLEEMWGEDRLPARRRSK